MMPIFFILLILCFAWGGDTCAYFAGRAFGKHKLCPVVSPKKTVEGAIGGVLGTMVCGVVVTLIYSIAADRMEAFTRSNIGCLDVRCHCAAGLCGGGAGHLRRPVRQRASSASAASRITAPFSPATAAFWTALTA